MPPYWQQRLRRRVRHLTPFLWIGIALLIEVVFHVSEFYVPAPAHELDPPFYSSCQEPDLGAPRENAALVMLARNSEVHQAKKTIDSIERRFNRWFRYPIIFLNNEPWSDEFIATLSAATNATTTFEVIPPESWTYPSWLSEDAAKASIKEQERHGVLYGGLETYHHMCRFFSGAFYKLAILRKYKWYWRLEPDVDFSCSITYDPFVEMARHKKVYGFTIALWEESATCPSLFRHVSDWKENNGIPTTNLWKASVSPSRLPWPLRGLFNWLPHRNRQGDVWNLCHYWSNFEIADLDFFRGAEYQKLYEHLEKKGGFYFERWGDAAVHAMAVNMLAEPRQVHHFADLAYRHDWYYQCPANAPGGQLLESEMLNSAEPEWADEHAGGIGCRCSCDGLKTRNQANYCLDKLREPISRKRPWGTWALSWVL